MEFREDTEVESWVVVVSFSSRAAASAFAAPVAGLLPGASFSAGVSSVVVRCGAWWCVAVPVSVLFPGVNIDIGFYIDSFLSLKI